jgi:2-oxoglutarate dehydrogenase E1 component
MAEALAFGSIVCDGIPIRMSGQDVGRGTFSHRHLELHDYEKASRFYPIASLAAEKSSEVAFELFNSTLSEEAVMGFEFGYAATHPKALVLWEAQFGDFANGAQVIIDQFLSGSEVKWGQRSGLVLLLPHGYEGQGPEHSSARLERFLQLCAEGNMTVLYPTTPAQYFHLLRRQAKAEVRRPVVVMTPKSLLRSPDATSKVVELTEGRFESVLEVPVGKASKQAPLVLMSGKIFYDVKKALEATGHSAHLLRVEELYPFPEKQLKSIAKDRSPKQVLWVQEEPQNMGAWNYIRSKLQNVFELEPSYVGRPEAASTACGSSKWHSIELTRILDEVRSYAKA